MADIVVDLPISCFKQIAFMKDGAIEYRDNPAYRPAKTQAPTINSGMAPQSDMIAAGGAPNGITTNG